MAKRKTNKRSISSLILLAVVLILSLLAKHYYDANENPSVIVSDNEVVIHIIDVGQGSSSLIQCGTNGILIDAGEAEYASRVCSYIKNAGVKKLEYVIASHPHSDHIGAMAKIIDTIETEHIVMPDIDDEYLPTTACFENLLLTIEKKDIDCIFWSYGDDIGIGIENVKVSFLGPVVQSESLNNMSLVCQVKAFGTSFIFPGDAEKSELKSIMQTKPNVACDIMIMSHHGSSNALYTPFLDRASFSVAVISCGKDNSYGHPHKETLNYLKKNKKSVIRTDLQGTVKISCLKDGYSIG